MCDIVYFLEIHHYGLGQTSIIYLWNVCYAILVCVYYMCNVTKRKKYRFIYMMHRLDWHPTVRILHH